MLIAVCDDEKEILEKIKEYLVCAMQNYPIGKHEIHLFWNMEDFIYQIEIMATAIPLALDGGLR